MKLNTTKRIVLLFIAIIMAASFVACGNKNAEPTDQPTLAPEENATVDTNTGETPEPTAVPTTDPNSILNFWHTDLDKSVYTILLMGLDELEDTLWARNDTTIILQINLETNEMKMVSFMRDMWIQIPGQDRKYRINNAHYRGGPELAVQTMKSAFGVDIDYYATVDFVTFEQIMMIIGPVVIRVKDYEIDNLNILASSVSIDGEMMQGQGAIQNEGLNELNAYQLLTLARDRHSTGTDGERSGDYGRNERQREIVKAAWTKVKTFDTIAIPAAVFAASVYAETDMPQNLIITLLERMMENDAEIIDMAMPVEGKFWELMIDPDDSTKEYTKDELKALYDYEKAQHETQQAELFAADPGHVIVEFSSYENWRSDRGFSSVIDFSQKNITLLHEFLGIN